LSVANIRKSVYGSPNVDPWAANRGMLREKDKDIKPGGQMKLFNFPGMSAMK
jgi:hypothetical protein